MGLNFLIVLGITHVFANLSDMRKDNRPMKTCDKRYKRIRAFYLVVSLLIFTRIIDNYTTYLFDPELQHEASPFVTMWRFHWTGLLVGQAVLLAAMIAACALDTFGTNKIYPRVPGLSFSDFMGYYNYGKQMSMPQLLFAILYKLPHAPTIVVRGLGYAVSRAWITMTVLVIISNSLLRVSTSYLQFYRMVFPQIVYILFGLALCAWLWAFFRKEYDTYLEIVEAEHGAPTQGELA